MQLKEPPPRLLRALRVLTFRLLHAHFRDHPIRTHVHGFPIQYRSRSHIAEMLYSGGFERSEIATMRRLLTRGDHFIDVGANVGFYSCLAGHAVGPTGCVYAYEPTPAVFSQLQENVALNKFTEAVRCFPMAVSNASGQAELALFPPGADVYNSIGATQSVDQASKSESYITVPTISLDNQFQDSVLTPPGRRLVIKIDVEGHEQKVIEGAVNLLRRHRHCAAMIELYEPAARQCGGSVRRSIEILQELQMTAYLPSHDGALYAPSPAEIRAIEEGTSRFCNVFFLSAAMHEETSAAGALCARKKR